MDDRRKDPTMDQSQIDQNSSLSCGSDEAFNERYKHLIAENNELKNQFMRLSEQNDVSKAIQTENIQLKAQITNFQSQIKELDERLQISVQINSDLKKEYESKLSIENRAHTEKCENMREQINKANQTIDDLQKQANKQKAEYIVEQENIKNENMVLKRQKANFFNQISHLFDYDFSEYNDIISYISSMDSKPLQIVEEDNSQFEQIQVIRNKYDKERQKVKSLNLELKSLLQDYESDKFSYNNTISGLTSKIMSLENELSRLEIEHRAEIELVKSQKLSQIPEIKIQSSVKDTEPQESESMTNAIKSLKEAHDRIRDLNNQIESLKSQNRQQQSELKQKERDIAKLTAKINSDQTSVQISYQSSVDTKTPVKEKEIETMKLQLTTAAASNIQAESAFNAVQKELENARLSIENNKIILDQQYSEICKLYSERSKLIELLQHQNTALSQYEGMTQNVEKIYISNENLENSQKDNQEIVFDFSDAPEEIKDALDRVAGNSQISIQMRLKGAIRVISKWASSITSKQDSSIMSLTEKIGSLESEKNRFCQSLCTVLQQNVDIKQIPEIINQILSENDNLKSELDHIKSKLSDLCEQLNVEDPLAVVDIVNELVAENNQNKEYIEEFNKKLNSTIKENRTLKKAIAKFEKRRQLDHSKYQDALDKASAAQEENQREIDSLQALNSGLVQQIGKLNREREEALSELRNQFEAELSHINSSSDISRLQSKGELSRLRGELDSRDGEITSLQAEVAQWKSAAQECSKEVGRLRLQLGESEEAHEKAVREVKEQHLKALQAKEGEFASAVEAMREHARTDSLLIEKTTRALKGSEARCKGLTQANQRLSGEVAQLETRLRSALESAERERQIEGAKARAELIAAEMRCSAECEGMRQKHEAHTRQLYSAAMSAFCAFCDDRCPLSEQSFFNVLERVKRELERLSRQDKSIRSITRAKDGVSTEDAVSELYLSSLQFSQQ